MKRLIPESIETPRLLLRQFEESDWDSLCGLYSDPEAVRYTLQVPQERWQTWRILALFVGHWEMRGYGPYAVVEKSSGNVMGPVGIWYPGEWPEPEIKYSLAREFWGKGYAPEAAAAIKTMAAETLKWKRLVSLIVPDNEKSIAVAKRIGGVYEKTIPFRLHQAQIYKYSL